MNPGGQYGSVGMLLAVKMESLRSTFLSFGCAKVVSAKKALVGGLYLQILQSRPIKFIC